MKQLSQQLNSFKSDFKNVLKVPDSRGYWFFKWFFDMLVCLLLLPGLIASSIAVLFLNPFFNKGPLLFVQTRMGKDCRPFQAIKFRTMSPLPKITRGHDDPIELERITPLGKLLRKTRLDELPQILNVLIGDMSLIGPRPDYYEHAQSYIAIIPGYKARHQVRPGISGLAQVSLGYAEGVEATREKTNADHYYINHANFRMDAKIVLKTLAIIASRSGA